MAIFFPFPEEPFMRCDDVGDDIWPYQVDRREVRRYMIQRIIICTMEDDESNNGTEEVYYQCMD